MKKIRLSQKKMTKMEGFNNKLESTTLKREKCNLMEKDSLYGHALPNQWKEKYNREKYHNQLKMKKISR